MEMQQLEYFAACAGTGSITRAAEVLYTSQPHVSQVVRSLERELNKQLFRRTRAGVVLTEDGEQILLYAENILKNAALLRSACGHPAGETLRIAANSSSRIALQLSSFYRELDTENTELQYKECSIEEMTNLLYGRQCDLGLLFVPENKLSAFRLIIRKKRLVFHTLLKSDLVLYCGRNCPFYERKTVTPRELAECRFIQMEDDFFSVEDILTEDPLFSEEKFLIRRAVRTNSNRLISTMVRDSGLVNLGSYWAKDDNSGPETRMVRVEGYEGKIRFGFLERSDTARPPLTDLFLDRLRLCL